MKDLRSSGKRLGKEVVVEPVNDDKYIDVNDEASDDDFVDMGGNNKFASGLRRSGSNKDKEVYDLHHAKIVASGSKAMVDFKVDGILSKLGLYVVDNFDENKMEIKLSKGSIVITKNMIGEMDAKEIKPTDVKMRMCKSEEADINFKLNFIIVFTSVMGNIRQKGVCDTDILDYITPNTNLSNVNWCEYVWRALKTCKKGWKKGKKDSYFRGPLTVLTMCYVDGIKCDYNIVFRRRPPTKAWTLELLSEREAEELCCEGFRHGELEEDFVGEEGDPIPNNIEGCIWMLKNYVKNKTKERKGFEKMLTTAEIMLPGNVKLIGFADKFADVRQDEESLFGFKRQENICRVLTQKVFEIVADEVERSIEKSKIMEIDDRPSFSFGVT
ncbi:hypothetical protein Tco_0830762 [Tanacetum coccineum]